jgi:hypothetical protein
VGAVFGFDFDARCPCKLQGGGRGGVGFITIR